MMRKQKTKGLTLIEILVAVAIVVILSAGLYIAGDYADKQAKIKQTQSTIEMLSAALEQYRDSNDCFPFTADNTFKRSDLQAKLGGMVSVNGWAPTDYNDHYASDDVLYYYLNRNPASKKIISSINSSLITNKDYMKREYFFVFTSDPAKIPYPLLHFVDAWNFPFRYTYNKGDNFPVITSAGPDRDFGDTIPARKQDNITSR
jgi:prepilin-type N-terminal cleavage/methylation domain-containing protein